MTGFQPIAVSEVRNQLRRFQVGSQARACGSQIGVSADTLYSSVAYCTETKKPKAKLFVSSGESQSRCGSPRCPSCRVYLMSQRVSEIQALIDWSRAKGYQVSMVTLTAPHGKWMSPADFLGSVRLRTGIVGAVARLRERSTWKKSVVEYVSTQEYTYGRVNGLHYHFHLLVVHSDDLNKSAWLRAWQKACVDSGLRAPSAAYGLTVQPATNAASYMAKWGVAAENAGGLHKRAANGNYSQVELESAVLRGETWAGPALRKINKLTYRRRVHTFSRGFAKLRQTVKRKLRPLGHVKDVEVIQGAIESGVTLGEMYKSGLVSRPVQTLEHAAKKHDWAIMGDLFGTARGLFKQRRTLDILAIRHSANSFI